MLVLGFMMGVIALWVIQVICRRVENGRARGLAGKTYSIYWKGDAPLGVNRSLPKAIAGILVASGMCVDRLARPDFRIVIARMYNNPEFGMIVSHNEWYFQIGVTYQGRKLADFGGYVIKGSYPDYRELVLPLPGRLASEMLKIESALDKCLLE